jgi:hypothetical protein
VRLRKAPGSLWLISGTITGALFFVTDPVIATLTWILKERTQWSIQMIPKNEVIEDTAIMKAGILSRLESIGGTHKDNSR